jgi:HSP20 family protein
MSLGRLLALMEDEDEAEAALRRECWVSKEDADAVKLKVAMPGLAKEHVKVWADQDDLVIEGEGDKDTEYDDDDEAPARYSLRVEFPEDDFKMDQIKAEMKDGVLKVTVPKIKLEERKDVFVVKVE